MRRARGGGEGDHHLAQLRRGVLDEGDQSTDGACVAGPSALDEPGDRGGRQAGTRRISASPCPPPPHNEAAPTPPPRRRSSSSSGSAIRAPDAPMGWPRAIAPPLTLTRSRSMPSSRVDWIATDAKASL